MSIFEPLHMRYNYHRIARTTMIYITRVALKINPLMSVIYDGSATISLSMHVTIEDLF